MGTRSDYCGTTLASKALQGVCACGLSGWVRATQRTQRALAETPSDSDGAWAVWPPVGLGCSEDMFIT